MSALTSGLARLHPEQLVDSRRVPRGESFASHLPFTFVAYRERAHGITSVPSVDLVHGLHEPRPSFVVDVRNNTLLPLCLSHYIGEEDARLMIDEALLIYAL